MMDCLPQLHVAAIHAESGYNTATPGIGVLCADGNYILGAGMFRNSISKKSSYAIGGKYLGTINGIQYGLIGGVINGYNNGKVLPLGGFVASYKQMHLLFTPPVSGQSPALVEVSFTIKGW
jgi:hypothetical protein